MAKIAVLDDDFAAEALVDHLVGRGHQAERVIPTGSADEIVARLADSDLVVMDVMLQRPEDVSEAAARGGHRTGLVLAQKLHERRPDLPILAFSASQDPDVQSWFRQRPKSAFINKLSLQALPDVARRIEAALTEPEKRPLPATFIVHGHDEATKYGVKNYLQNTLGFAEPIILHEQPSLGRTLLEKFEHYSMRTEIVFVLLTPDDKMADAATSNQERRRARQNVIFELGYFLGQLKRSSGRVILLYKGHLELPSDISGLVYIDITNGIEAAGEAIRKELRDVVGG